MKEPENLVTTTTTTTIPCFPCRFRTCQKGNLILLTFVLVVLGSLQIQRPNSNGDLTLRQDIISKNKNNRKFRNDHGNSSRNYTLNPSSEGEAVQGQTVYPIGDDYLFWSGHSKICTLLRNITGVSKLGREYPPRYFDVPPQPPLVNLTLNCTDRNRNTGNWITALYHLRLAAALGRVDFQFQCDDGMETAESSVLPWLSGFYPSQNVMSSTSRSISNISSDEWQYDFGWPEVDLVCSDKYNKLPLQHMAHEMQKDMRSMAVAMLGSRHFNASGLERRIDLLRTRVQDRRPGAAMIYPREDLAVDDAAIHFRCGDVFGGTQKDVYGLIKFKEFKNLIPQESTNSIGIFTQPFHASRVRPEDRDFVQQCERVVNVLVEYLHNSYPNATISIRNTLQDTIPITYARMIMASQTITTMSTFGIFPAIGSFGDGYFKSSGRQNRFARLIPHVLPNFHELANGTILSSPEIRKSTWNDVVTFLTQD